MILKRETLGKTWENVVTLLCRGEAFRGQHQALDSAVHTQVSTSGEDLLPCCKMRSTGSPGGCLSYKESPCSRSHPSWGKPRPVTEAGIQGAQRGPLCWAILPQSSPPGWPRLSRVYTGLTGPSAPSCFLSLPVQLSQNLQPDVCLSSCFPRRPQVSFFSRPEEGQVREP